MAKFYRHLFFFHGEFSAKFVFARVPQLRAGGLDAWGQGTGSDYSLFAVNRRFKMFPPNASGVNPFHLPSLTRLQATLTIAGRVFLPERQAFFLYLALPPRSLQSSEHAVYYAWLERPRQSPSVFHSAIGKSTPFYASGYLLFARGGPSEVATLQKPRQWNPLSGEPQRRGQRGKGARGTSAHGIGRLGRATQTNGLLASAGGTRNRDFCSWGLDGSF